MRIIKTPHITAAVLLSCIVAVPLSAGQARKTQNRNTTADRAERRVMRFQGMDVNIDGVITREEWRRNERAFERHDINRDGVLSGSEIWTNPVPQGTAGWSERAESENPSHRRFAAPM
jgi:hypothetical protein